jgi:hypothetical protein
VQVDLLSCRIWCDTIQPQYILELLFEPKQDIVEFLNQAGITCRRLDRLEHRHHESAWRNVYGNAFRGRPRLRHGARAEFEYLQRACEHWLIVPFITPVPGLPVDPYGSEYSVYECTGSIVSLASYHVQEFFVAPLDFDWTMVYTHEDYAFGGPYFVKREWVVA